MLTEMGLPPTYPKVLAPVGPRGRPLLEYAVRLLSHHGLKSVTFVTRFDSDAIQEFFGDGTAYGLRASYFAEHEGMGNGEAVAEALSSCPVPYFDHLLVYYGDILSDLDVTEFMKTHISKRAEATLAIAPRYRLAADVVRSTRGLVSKVLPEPELNQVLEGGEGGYAMIGIVALSRKSSDLLREFSKPRLDLMRDFMPYLVGRSAPVAAYFHRGFWSDIGTPESYSSITKDKVARHFGFLEDEKSRVA